MNPIALEAVHIKWHNAGGPDDEKNGLALCSLHSKLFDRGAFTLTDNFEIMVSDRVFGSCGFNEWLMAFHGKRINPPKGTSYLPSLEFCDWHVICDWHVKEVFHGEFREA
jgi:putative restriction endonuclease